MQIYASIDDVRMPLAAVAGHAQRAERLGCDGLVVPEAVYDAIPAATLALAATTRLRVATGVVVAFARSPMLLAQDAWALAQLSGGRFELGLGPQVKGNVEKRFGMPWSAPAARMHDYVGAAARGVRRLAARRAAPLRERELHAHAHAALLRAREARLRRAARSCWARSGRR